MSDFHSTSNDTGYGVIVKVEGEATNTCGRELRYAQISFRILDADGALTGNVLTNASGIRPRQSWRFRGSGTATGDPSRVEIDEISSF